MSDTRTFEESEERSNAFRFGCRIDESDATKSAFTEIMLIIMIIILGSNCSIVIGQLNSE